MSKFKGFIDAIVRGDLKDVSRRFRREYIHQKMRGWSALHLACKIDDAGRIARYLINEGWDIEEELDGCTTFGGGRSIHIAAYYGRAATMMMLLDMGCSFTCLTSNKRTPMDLLIETDNVECTLQIQSYMNKKKYLEQLKNNSLSKIIVIETNKTLFDNLINLQDPTILDAIKYKPMDEQEIQDWTSLARNDIGASSHDLLHECLLFKSIHQKYDDGVYTLCTAEIVNRDSLFYGPSPLETAVEYGTVFCVQHILAKLINEDDTWTRALEIARRKKSENVVSLISNRSKYLKRRTEKGHSRLHIAVLDNDPDMVKYLQERKIVNPDDVHKIFGTALSLAYWLDNIECTEVLIQCGVNVNTVDRYQQSPLHVAISNRIEDHCDYLVRNTKDIEAEDYMGFTPVERAVMNACEVICDVLVKYGANTDKCVKTTYLLSNTDCSNVMSVTDQETLYSTCMKTNRTIYPCLVHGLSQHNVDLVDSNGNTLLHLCAVSLKGSLCQQLIEKLANVNFCNESGNTPLLELLRYNYDGNKNGIMGEMVDTVRVLIAGGASIGSLEDVGGYHDERLYLELTKNSEFTSLVTAEKCSEWLKERYFLLLRNIVPLLHKEVCREFITHDLICELPNETDASFVTFLYDNATQDVKFHSVEKLLYKAHSIGDIATFQYMVNDPISPLGYLDGGETLLTRLIREKSQEFIQIVLRSKNSLFYLERKNAEGMLALHVCIECEYWSIIDEIISDTNKVDVEDDRGSTALSLLFVKISETEEDRDISRLMTYIKMLITKSANIYGLNQRDKCCIEYCTRPHMKYAIEEFFNEHSPLRSITNQSSEEGSLVPKISKVENNSENENKRICMICVDEPMDCVLNCGHMFCMTCAEREIYCYLCRNVITVRIRTFI